MANAWLRLWHDMPNDPKWRTIARVSGQPIATVMAVYIHLLVSASRNVTRGHIDVTTEDLASALDVTEEVIDSILQTMQGRVLDGDLITGWENARCLKRTTAIFRKPQNLLQSARGRSERGKESGNKMAIVTARHEMSRTCHDKSRQIQIQRKIQIKKIKTLWSMA